MQLSSPLLPVQDLARQLRTGEPSILPTVQDDKVILDVRTLEESELAEICARVKEIIASAG